MGTNATSFLPQEVFWTAGLSREGEITGQYMEHLSGQQNCPKKEHADLTVSSPLSLKRFMQKLVTALVKW